MSPLGWIVVPAWLGALIAFHMGLFLIFTTLYFMLTGKPFRFQTGYGDFSPEAGFLIGVGETIFGLFLLWIFNMFNYWWIIFTLFQLGLSSFVLLGAVLTAPKERRFKEERSEMHRCPNCGNLKLSYLSLKNAKIEKWKFQCYDCGATWVNEMRRVRTGQ